MGNSFFYCCICNVCFFSIFLSSNNLSIKDTGPCFLLFMSEIVRLFDVGLRLEYLLHNGIIFYLFLSGIIAFQKRRVLRR